MAQGLNQTSNNHYEIIYSQPWGGIASNADPTDIAVNQFAASNDVVIRNGRLCSWAWNLTQRLNYKVSPGTTFPQDVWALFNIGANLYALDYAGHAYKYDSVTQQFFLLVSLGETLGANGLCYQIVAGVVYIFDYTLGQMYVFNPATPSYTVGQNFVAGLYCMTLDEYLLTANSNMPSDNPAIKTNRISWSAPDSFTTWNPAVNRQAGYDVLQDVTDNITGMFSMGNVGYVLRNQGLTQLTPTGIAIQPFNFTPVYNSQYGLGCTYPGSLAVYGLIAIWMNDTNIYAFIGGVPQEITGAAKAAIYADLYAAGIQSVSTGVFVNGTFSAVPGDTNSPELVYTLCIAPYSVAAGQTTTAIFWQFNVNAKTWTRSTLNLNTAVSAGANGVIMRDFVSYQLPQATFTPILSQQPAYFTQALLVTVPTVTPESYLIDDYTNTVGENNPVYYEYARFSISFRMEEFKLGRKPQVRGVAIRAAGFGTLYVQIGNVMFTDIVLNNSVPQTYYSYGVFEAEDPQLTITGQEFSGYLVKVYMFGTYAEGELG